MTSDKELNNHVSENDNVEESGVDIGENHQSNLCVSLDVENETDIDKLKSYIETLESDKTNLIKINSELSTKLYEMDNPERALLCISHKEERAFEAEQKLMTLYQACHENRVAISDVRDKDGNVLEALCLMVPSPNGDDTLNLLPIFSITEMGMDESFEFPTANGGWQSDTTDGVIEASLLAN